MNIDPITNQPLPADAIQRVLFIANKVHIYTIPPISSTRGFNAASWTADPRANIFTARLRIVETSIPAPAGSAQPEAVSAVILLEDPESGDLFAAAPYSHAAAVEQALDSSRFFAVRVVGGGGRKATLGIGFEERPEAFDFGVALQDMRRTLGLESAANGPGLGAKGDGTSAGDEAKRDLSLKDGEMITINIGGKGRRITGGAKSENSSPGLFSIAPPPAPGRKEDTMSILTPPPSAGSIKSDLSSKQLTAAEMGFDDGEFGEFQ